LNVGVSHLERFYSLRSPFGPHGTTCVTSLRSVPGAGAAFSLWWPQISGTKKPGCCQPGFFVSRLVGTGGFEPPTPCTP